MGQRTRTPRDGACTSAPDCAESVFARTMCRRHYNIWHYATMPAGRARPGVSPCQIEGCTKPAKSRGWCKNHYTNWQAFGDPLGMPERPCARCELPFKAYGRGMYCTRCLADTRRDRSNSNSARRRARLAAQTVEEFESLEIYVRDNWICGICGGPIDRALRWPHRLSVSLDHVIPLAHEGPHSRANTQAAHLRCNIAKNTTVIDE